MNKHIFKFDQDNLRLKETFKDGKKLKEIHIEIYPNNPIESHTPFKLFIRATEKNVVVSNDGNRLIFKKSNRLGTHIVNVPLSDIVQCMVNTSDERYVTFVLNIQNIWYKVTIPNN